jgi:hypothetical protein
MGLDIDSQPGDQRRMRWQINLICAAGGPRPRRSLGEQIGGYARACRRGRRPRSAIIGGMLEAERHQQGAR